MPSQTATTTETLTMSSMLLKSGVAALGGVFLETKFSPSSASSGQNGLPSFFAVTPAILIGAGFWITTFGMKVGKARNKAIEMAKKDGEKDVDERYDLPNLYAQGTSKHVRTFNCVQRAHQHIFEGFTQVSISAVAAAMSFPISAAAATLTYTVGRYALSNGYAAGDGDASKRYASPLAKYMWIGMLTNYMLGFMSCAYMVSKNIGA